jgi:hypothetical protein
MSRENDTAELDLRYVSRKAKRMFTRKTFRAPDPKDRAYKYPAKVFRTNGVIDCCVYCKRPTAFGSRRCRECYQQQVRAKHEAKVRAEDERVRANERAFLTVTQREEVMPKAKKQSPIARSTSGLRETIFQEMEALRSGESTWQRARSMAMLANTVLDSVKTEVEYHKYVVAAPKVVENSTDNVKRLGTDIQLGQQAA